jgi:hypothetical protein
VRRFCSLSAEKVSSVISPPVLTISIDYVYLTRFSVCLDSEIRDTVDFKLDVDSFTIVLKLLLKIVEKTFLAFPLKGTACGTWTNRFKIDPPDSLAILLFHRYYKLELLASYPTATESGLARSSHGRQRNSLLASAFYNSIRKLENERELH